MSLKPQQHGTPYISVSYDTVDAGIFPQEGNEIQYASLDRAREIVAKMPDNARNILLAPLKNGLIDAQSVFYLINDSIDGQIAIFVQDFADLTARRKDETVVTLQLIDTVLLIANGKVMTNDGTSVPETKIQSHTIHTDESGGYLACKSQREFLASRVERSTKRQRCLTSVGILVFILCCLIMAGVLIIWLQENPTILSTVVPTDAIRTTTAYQRPQDYIAGCVKALHETTSSCGNPTSAGFGCINGCRPDGTSEGCGWFLIHENYFKDCTEKDPGITQDWRNCSLDYDCSTRCVMQYYRRYQKACPETMDECECLVRNHVGGSKGWNKTMTIKNWERVRGKLNEVIE